MRKSTAEINKTDPDVSNKLHSRFTFLTAEKGVGKTTVCEQTQKFGDGCPIMQGQKGRNNFWGYICGKWGIVLLG